MLLVASGCTGLEDLHEDPDMVLQVDSPKVVSRAWEVVTGPHPDIGTGLEIDPYGTVYATLGEQIGRWDGGQWVTVTDLAPGLRPHLSYVSESEIYALVDEHIELWDGAQWYPVTDSAQGLSPGMLTVTETAIFASFSSPERQSSWVGLWNGNEWIPFTTELPGIELYFTLRGSYVYAPSSGAIRRYDGVSWQAVSDAVEDLGPDAHVLGDDSALARVKNEIWRWDGADFAPLTDDPGESIGDNIEVGPTGLVYALVGQHVERF